MLMDLYSREPYLVIEQAILLNVIFPQIRPFQNFGKLILILSVIHELEELLKYELILFHSSLCHRLVCKLWNWL